MFIRVSSWTELGFDSLLMLNLQERLASYYNVELDVTFLFQHTCIQDVVQYFDESILKTISKTTSLQQNGEKIGVTNIGLRFPGSSGDL